MEKEKLFSTKELASDKNKSFEAFLSSTSHFSLKESHLGLLKGNIDSQYIASSISKHSMELSRQSSSGSITGHSELIRVPAENISITKEKPKGNARAPIVPKELSKPSRGGSAQTSGRTTPTLVKPQKMLSEAAIRVSASLLSHNDRLNESPAHNNVFNAEYNATPVKDSRDSVDIHEELNPLSTNGSSKSPVIDSPRDISRSDSLLSGAKDLAAPRVPDIEPVYFTPLQFTDYKAARRNVSPTGDADSLKFEELLKINAQLEGKLEMLSKEADTALKERAKYQTELGALKTKLQLYEQKQQTNTHLVSPEDYNSLQRALNDFQKQSIDLSRQLTAKSTEYSRLSESWAHVKELNNKLTLNSTTYLQQIKESESEIVKLKSQSKNLESRVSIMTEEKQQSIDKIASLQDDMTSLNQTKDWYQQQLHSAQEMRNNLHSELTRLQNLVSIQADALERVKVENSQLRHQLNDTQHKALTEKQLLIRHLEAIEADMLEREESFEQLEQEKGLTEYSWQQKMMQIEKERMSLSKMVANSSDLQQELLRTQHSLEEKSAQIEVLETQQDELNKRLWSAQQTEQIKSKELELTREKLLECETLLQKVQKQDKERGALIQTLKQDKAALQISLDSAVEERKSFSKAVETLKADTAKVEQNYRQMKQELADKTLAMANLEREKAELIESNELIAQESVQKLSASSGPELKNLQTDFQTLKEHVQQLRTTLEDSEDRVERLSVEKKTLEQQLSNMKSNAAELEHILQKSHAEKTSLEAKVSEISLRLHELTKVKDSEQSLQQNYNNLSSRVHELQALLSKSESTLKERTAQYETSQNLLNKQLQEALGERDTARRSLREHEETMQTTSSSQLEHLYAQIQMYRSQLEASQIQKTDMEKQISSYQSSVQTAVQEYQKRISETTSALSHCQKQLNEERLEYSASIDRYRAECDTNRKISIELEKERGKLSALAEQYSKLKQHTTDLENALSLRESTLVHLNAASASLTQKYAQFEEEQQLRLRQLQEDLLNQTNVCDTLQQQLDNERKELDQLKELQGSQNLELEALKQEIDKKSLSIVSLQSELSSANELLERQNTNIAMLNKEYRTAKIELEQLRRTNSENAAKNPIISDEIQALQWQVKQKTQEASDAKNQLNLYEQRLSIEADSFKQVLADTKKELDIVKLELSAIRKEKFSYQNHVTMLRSALRNLLAQCKVISSSLVDSSKSELRIDESKYEELLKETAAPGYKSKPLDNLKTCLKGLHSEMTTLQYQMDEHKNALKTNSESWRAVETEVADLEKLITASREATKVRSSLRNENNGNVI